MMMKIQGLCIVLLSLISIFVIANCISVKEPKNGPLGGFSNSNGNPNNGGDVSSIGKYAVDEQNKKANTNLEFVRVVKAKQQVVSGKMYNLVVEANDGGKKNQYAAKVLVKPWMHFKQLQAFDQVPNNA